MADFTIVNLKEVDNAALKFGLSPGLEARFAREPLELTKSGVSYYRVAPDFRVPFGHRHQEQEEVYIVLSGSARMKLEDEIVELKAWDAIRVAPETTRDFEAGPEGAEILAFGAPKTEGQDAEIEQDWWS